MVFHGFKKLARFLLIGLWTVVLCRGALRLEQRNLLQFARVPTKLSGGFTAAFFFPGFQIIPVAVLLMRAQSTYEPVWSCPCALRSRVCF